MKPLMKGIETGIVKIPANWCVSLFQSVPVVPIVHRRYLDDLPPMMWVILTRNFDLGEFPFSILGSSSRAQTRTDGYYID